MPTQEIYGFAMHYRDEGKGSPIVLIHGFPLKSQIFDAQIAALSKTHRVIAPDLRGFGQSPSTASFSINSLADDVHKLLSRIGALPCVLGGLSMGGYVAQSFIRKYPADVSKLMLINTKVESDSAQAREGRNKMIQLCRTSGSAGVAKEMLPKMLAPSTLSNRPELVSAVVKIMESTPAIAVEHALEALRDRDDQTQFVTTIRVPTLLITGEGDAITGPGVMGPIHKSIPGSTYAVIRDAGHLSTMENPDAVNTAIGQFLQK